MQKVFFKSTEMFQIFCCEKLITVKHEVSFKYVILHLTTSISAIGFLYVTQVEF